jgi:flagellar motor switch protein FliG
MADANANFSGAERAAILLMSLGEDEASSVLKLMEPHQVQKLGAAMATMRDVSHEQVAAVVDQFLASFDTAAALPSGNDYVRNILVKAVGEQRARALMSRAARGGEAKGLEALKWMDARSVAEVIREEHPQIIAIILAQLESSQASGVVAQLPEALRADVVMRVANLDEVPESALDELDDIIEKQFAASASLRSSLGGTRVAANLLNQLDTATESRILEEIGKADEDLGHRIQELMFVFDNLLQADDRGIQTLLREIPSDDLVLALKAADPEVKEKILRNMSKRAAEILRDDLEAKGPVRLSEAEEAQKRILERARELADEGRMILGGRGGDDYV